MARTVEVQVLQVPTNTLITCPKCYEDIEFTYSEFCDQFGEPCDWNFNKLKCPECGEELEIQGADW